MAEKVQLWRRRRRDQSSSQPQYQQASDKMVPRVPVVGDLLRLGRDHWEVVEVQLETWEPDKDRPDFAAVVFVDPL